MPCLRDQGATVWYTLAIGEYRNEIMPDADLLPVVSRPLSWTTRSSSRYSVPAPEYSRVPE